MFITGLWVVASIILFFAGISGAQIAVVGLLGLIPSIMLAFKKFSLGAISFLTSLAYMALGSGLVALALFVIMHTVQLFI